MMTMTKLLAARVHHINNSRNSDAAQTIFADTRRRRLRMRPAAVAVGEDIVLGGGGAMRFDARFAHLHTRVHTHTHQHAPTTQSERWEI